MAEALLEVVLENLNSFVQKELASFWGIDGEMEKLSSKLTTIQAVLEDAELQQRTAKAVNVWLQKLKNAAYMLDDILDECSIEFIQLGCEGENSGSANRVSSLSFSSLTPKNMLFRFKVGRRMKEIRERLNQIAEDRHQFHLHEGNIKRQIEGAEWRQTSSIITQPQVYGRDEDREKIVEFLLSQAGDCDGLSIYPIVGIGGLGKTTLAQAVFNDERVSRHFELKIWVCVSEVFSLMKVLQSIIESLTGQNSNFLNLDSMQKKVQELMQSKRYILVLDDVWNENQEKWDRLKYVLDCGSRGASILVTTRRIDVASIMGTHPAHFLLGLSEDDSWSLFKQCAFRSHGEECTELVAIGKEIVRKCGGLPLAVKTLGSLMRFKSGEKEWLYVKESKLWDLPENENSILPALILSYFNLSLTLRQCFAFCAIFPKDTDISKETLIHLWVGNGFISSRNNLEMEDVGNMVWNELYQRSFFQDIKMDEVGNTESFRIHDLLHDLAQFVSGEDQCVVQGKAGLTKLSRSTHHVGYLDSSDESLMDKLFKSLRLQKMESLRTYFQFDSSSTLSHASSTYRSLRVLRTSAYKLSLLPHLIHLRYLNLNCFFVRTLPESICNLRKLQTLKLENCEDLHHLPKQLAQLQDLRHLVIKGFDTLSEMPPKIRKLTSLRTLSLFIVSSTVGHHLEELQNLQLGGELEIKGLENVLSELAAQNANLTAKKNLNRLYLSWDGESRAAVAEQVLEALQPHSNLKSFGIKGYEGIQFCSWMKSASILNCLVSLELKNCKNCRQLPPLGKLPSLSSLLISGMKDVCYIDDDSYVNEPENAFRSLKTLSLLNLPNLKRMLREDGAQMSPCLLKLKISDVPEFTLPCLPSVQHLEVGGCNERLLKSIADYQGLEFLMISGNEDIISFPEGIMQNLCHLKALRILGFNKLKAFPNELNSLTTLKELAIRACHELEEFSENVLQGLSSLHTLRIINCEKFRSLSEGVRHLSSLRRLEIVNCENNVILEGVERIPTLLSIHLIALYNLESLPDSLGNLTSLQEVEIINCSKLSSLPTSFELLHNLQKLYISGCPKLKKRCKKGTGEDWHKIQHVPHIKLEQEPTFCESARMLWKMQGAFIKQFANGLPRIYGRQ